MAEWAHEVRNSILKEVTEKAPNQLYKADGGKLRPSLLLEGMPRALMLVIAILTYGAIKYEAHSWKQVETHRYKDSKLRHMFEMLLGFDPTDDESGLLHDAHEITNALFLLEQKLCKLPENEFRELLVFNQPPQDHKK